MDNRIRLVSVFFKWVFILIMTALPILNIVFWWHVPNALTLQGYLTFTPLPDGVKVLHTLSVATKFIGFMMTLIPVGLQMLVCFFLFTLFHRFAQRRIFTIDNVVAVKRVAITILVSQLINPVYQLLISGLLTWQNPVGKGVAQIELTGANIGLLLMALLIVFTSWIMHQGYQLQQDQQYTV